METNPFKNDEENVGETIPLVPQKPKLTQCQTIRFLNDDPQISRLVLDVIPLAIRLTPSIKFWLRGRSHDDFPLERQQATAAFVIEFLRGFTFSTETVWPLTVLGLLFYRPFAEGTCDFRALFPGHHVHLFSSYWWPLVALTTLPLIIGTLNGLKSLVWRKKLNENDYQNTWQLNRAEFAIMYDGRYTADQKQSIYKHVEDSAENATNPFKKLAAIKTLTRLRDNKRNRVESESSLIELSKSNQHKGANRFRQNLLSIFTYYELWRLGFFIKHDDTSWKKRGLMYSVFSLITLYQLASKLLVLYIWIEKIIQSKKYSQALQACEAEQGTYQYIEELANYACTICGDWQDVYILDRFSPQGCIEGLLRNPLTPRDVINRINKIVSKHKIEHANFSQQNFNLWSKQDWQSLFDVLKINNPEYNFLDFSQDTTPTDDNQTQDMIKQLGRFAEQVNIGSIRLQQLGLTSQVTKPAIFAFATSKTKNVDLSNNLLDDQITDYLKQQQNKTSLEQLTLSNNKIKAENIDQLEIPSLRKLVLDSNPISQAGFNSLSRFFNHSQVTSFSISDVNVSGMQIDQFITSLANSSVKVVRLSNLHATGYQVYSVATQAPKSQWESLDISRNAMNLDITNVLIVNLRDATVSKLDISGTRLDGQGLKAIEDNIADLPLTTLNLADNDFSEKAFTSFMAASENTALKDLNVANNRLKHIAAQAVYKAMMQNKQQYERLDLGNNEIPDSDGADIVQATQNSALKGLSIRKNNLGTQTSAALKESLPNNLVEALDLSGNNFGVQASDDISQGFSGSNLISLDLADNPLTPAGINIISSRLVNPNQVPGAASHRPLSVHQRCELSKTVPATKLKHLDFTNTQANTASFEDFCANLPGSGIPIENTEFNNNNAISSSWNTKNCVPRQQFFQPEPNARLNQNSAFGLSTLCGYLLPFLLFVAALYVLYRAFKPLATYIYDKFTNNSDDQPDFEKGYQA